MQPKTIAAGSPCGPDFEAASAAITRAPLGQGLERKLLTKVINARRMIEAGGKKALKNAVHQLDDALHLLASPSTKQIPQQARNEIRAAIEALRRCLLDSSLPETVAVAVRTFFQSDAAADGKGGPAGAGVILRVAGIEVGTTGPDGTATIQAPSGTILIEARLYPSSLGTASVLVNRGETGQVDIILADGKEIAEDTDLLLDESPDGVLAQDFSSFTLRFLTHADATVPLAHLDEVELLHPSGGPSMLLQDRFALQADGTVVAKDVAWLRALLLARTGKLEMRVHGQDASGRTHDGVVRIYLGRFLVKGRLQAPPSNPALVVSQVGVTAAILNTPLVLSTISGPSGELEFPLLPSGNLELHGQTLQNGRYYYGQGIAVLNRNLLVTATMLYTADVINGVPGFSVTPLTALAGAEVEERVPARELASAGKQLGPDAEASLLRSITSAAAATVNVTAAAQNAPITGNATLSVAKGTKKVTLKYRAQTDEYPYWVQAQSIYNDTWSLNVRGGDAGQQLFDLSRQINSQLYMAPVWQFDGTTGVIQEVLDVESLAAGADTTLTLFASAMNVGDGILPTRVFASLSGDTEVRIDSITPDSVTPTTGDGSYYSIPRAGATNLNERWFTLKITKPDGTTVKKITATLLGPGELMTLVDDPPGDGVQVVDETTVRVRVTLHALASSVEGQPPPAHELMYRFKLTVDQDGTELTDQKDSGARHALWRMPDGFDRYSTRDAGGDDWCSRAAYSWMETNRGLLQAINDVSGEHARNIGHSTHQYGTDIDMFHFYRFPGATSGADNDTRLRADTILAIRTNDPDATIRQQATAARARVSAWVTATRSGIDNLAQLGTVASILYARGVAGGGLPGGWAQGLLTTGATTVNDQALDLGLGSWTNAKYRPRDDHNDHVHITLNRAALGE